MSLQDKFDPHKYVAARAAAIIKKAKRSGAILNATVEAHLILDEGVVGYLTLSEVAEEIARRATEKGVPVEIGETTSP